MKRATIALALIVAIAASAPVAGVDTSKGTISGTVQNIWGKPLAYANVIVVGTNLGAMSLEDGSFQISNVDPGIYTIRALMMGFKQNDTDSVVVTAGHNTRLAFCMESTPLLKTQEIIVNGDKPMVEVETSDTRRSISPEELEAMPVDQLLEDVALKAGIVKQGDEMHVRGGRSSETQIQIEGVKVNKPVTQRVQGVGQSRTYTPPPARTRCTPNQWNTETYAPITENTFRSAVDHPQTTFSIDVDAASYSNVRRFLKNGRIPPRDAVRIEELVNYFQYEYPQPRGREPFSVTMETAQCPWQPDNRLLHIGIRGKLPDRDDNPKSNLVFLIDVSGSMRDANKLPLLQEAFKMLVDRVDEDDRIAIVVYAGSSGIALESTRGKHRQTIRNAIDGLRANGSTNGASGIVLAYDVARKNFIKGGNNRVILATDGDFNVGVTSDGDMKRLIEEQRDGGIFLTVLGFGEANLKDSKMEAIADHGNGHYAYIDDIFEARKVFVEELDATLFTIAKDVKLQLEFNPTKVASYRLIGYENRLLAPEDFDNDRKDAGEIGAGHTVTALYEIVPAAEAEEPLSQLTYIRTAFTSAASSGELLTLRIRYKEPDAKESRLLSETLLDHEMRFDETSDDFRFAAAVAEFGMLLRGSAYAGEASWERVINTASAARGVDPHGRRAEFVRLAELSRDLSGR